MKRVFTFLLALGLLMPNFTMATPSPDIFLSSNSVVNRHHRESRESSVKIVTLRGHGSGSYFRAGQRHFILTAKHVLRGVEIVTIQAGGNELVIGEVKWRSETQDIAIIEIPELQTRNPARIRTSNIRELEIGDELVYSGYPGRNSLLTSGAMVSGTNNGRYILQGFAWPGSSGSGIIDERGKIRGVLVAIGIEWAAGNPQLLETVVWMEPITTMTWREIRTALEL